MSFSSNRITPQEIIDALIDREKTFENDYLSQKQALEYALSEVKEQTVLSVNLIKEFHKILVPEALREERDDNDIPGQFRNCRLFGGSVPDSRGTLRFSLAGIKNILSLIEKERADFDEDQGTVLHSYDDQTIYKAGPEFEELLRNKSRDKLAEEIYLHTRKNGYVLTYPTCNKSCATPREFMEYIMNELVNDLNRSLQSMTEQDKIIEKIASFIQSCQQKHPFYSHNHRVFVLCVLNFLLLRYNIGYCPLESRRIFRTISVNEIVAILKGKIVLANYCPSEVAEAKLSDNKHRLFTPLDLEALAHHLAYTPDEVKATSMLRRNLNLLNVEIECVLPKYIVSKVTPLQLVHGAGDIGMRDRVLRPLFIEHFGEEKGMAEMQRQIDAMSNVHQHFNFRPLIEAISKELFINDKVSPETQAAIDKFRKDFDDNQPKIIEKGMHFRWETWQDWCEAYREAAERWKDDKKKCALLETTVVTCMLNYATQNDKQQFYHGLFHLRNFTGSFQRVYVGAVEQKSFVDIIFGLRSLEVGCDPRVGQRPSWRIAQYKQFAKYKLRGLRDYGIAPRLSYNVVKAP